MALDQQLRLLPELCCLLLCLAAAVTDLRSLRIPNPLTYGGLGLGLTLSFGLSAVEGGVSGGLSDGLWPSLGGSVFLLAVFGAMSALGVTGMGDTKLMAAVGALLKWPLCLQALLYVLLAGGALSLFLALTRGRLRAVLGNLVAGGRNLLSGRRDEAPLELHRIPYGVAIALGVAWTVLVRHFPSFSVF